MSITVKSNGEVGMWVSFAAAMLNKPGMERTKGKLSGRLSKARNHEKSTSSSTNRQLLNNLICLYIE